MSRLLTRSLGLVIAGLLGLATGATAQAPNANPAAQVRSGNAAPQAQAKGPGNGADVTPGGATGAKVSATATGLAGGGTATAAGVLAALGLAVVLGGGNNGVATTTTTTGR